MTKRKLSATAARAAAQRMMALTILATLPGLMAPAARADLSLTAAPLVAASATGATSSGETSYHRFSRFVSGAGTAIFIGGSLILPLIEDGKAGKNESLRTADSIIVTSVATEVLKATTKLKRPGGGKNGFPSGHTSAAFAAATMASHFHPKQAPFWYLGATLIGASRVELRAHHTYQVVAGAALGYGISRLELARPHGLVLAPFIKTDGERHTENTLGLQVTKVF